MLYLIVHSITCAIFKLAALVLGRLRRIGVDNVPKTGAVIYCPNHVSDADPPIILISIPRRAWFIGKEELFKIPVASWLFRNLHGLPIKRDSADRAALRRIEDLLKRGEPVLIFPEGRCSRDGKLQRIQPGAALMSLRAGAPIVPIGLRHSAEVLPYGSLMPRFSRDPVTVEFGPPIYPAEFDNLPKNERVDALTERLGQEIARLTGQEPPPVERQSTTRKQRPSPETDAEAA